MLMPLMLDRSDPRPPLQGFFHGARGRAVGIRVVGCIKLAELLQDPLIAIGDFLLVELVEVNGLLQAEQMLGPVVAVQGAGNGGLAVLATLVPKSRQSLGVALSCKDRLDDPHAGHPGDVGDDVVQLQVHLGQSLLHPLDVGGGAAHQGGPLAHIGPQRTHLIGRTKGAAQQAVGVQLLQPLAIQNVALTAGDIFDVPGVDQFDLQSVALQNFKDRNPVNARRFHSHGGNAAGDQPLGQAFEIVGEG